MVRLFGKKKEEEFPELSSAGFGSASGVPGPASDYNVGLPPPPQPVTPSSGVTNEHIQSMTRSVELVSSKLDTLKASIDALNQRLANIEASIKEQANQKVQQQSQPDAFSTALSQQPQQQYQYQQQPQQQQQEDQGWHY